LFSVAVGIRLARDFGNMRASGFFVRQLSVAVHVEYQKRREDWWIAIELQDA